MPNFDSTHDIWRQLILNATGCDNPVKMETIQSLWSGFGEIFRVRAGVQSLVVKQVSPQSNLSHPRGWSSDFATNRKLRSYQVENHWYKHYSQHCSSDCRVPGYITDQLLNDQSWLILEDLDASGYSLRHQAPDVNTAACCLDWLARFHAQFMGIAPQGLWLKGCYWHLDTRPDEYQSMQAGPLKQHAYRIDRILNNATYQTLVHGDAKVANFCFANNGRVAAVDFQYVGGGCGIKDVVYFIGSCFTEDECEDYADDLLNRYFCTLSESLRPQFKTESQLLQQEWRSLYALAWTDFYRFLAGWMPTHKKIHRYTKHLAEQTFDSLGDFDHS